MKREGSKTVQSAPNILSNCIASPMAFVAKGFYYYRAIR